MMKDIPSAMAYCLWEGCIGTVYYDNIFIENLVEAFPEYPYTRLHSWKDVEYAEYFKFDDFLELEHQGYTTSETTIPPTTSIYD